MSVLSMIIRLDTENSHCNYLVLVMLTCKTKMVKDWYCNIIIVIVLMLYFIAKVLVHTVAGKAECSYFQLFS